MQFKSRGSAEFKGTHIKCKNVENEIELVNKLSEEIENRCISLYFQKKP